MTSFTCYSHLRLGKIKNHEQNTALLTSAKFRMQYIIWHNLSNISGASETGALITQRKLAGLYYIWSLMFVFIVKTSQL